MKSYKIKEYQTVYGKYDFVDLGNSSYGEWIIYKDNKPKYHVNIFREDFESDIEVKALIEKSNLCFEELLKKIGFENKIKLSLGKKPLLKLEPNSGIRELNLSPIPIEWMKKWNQNYI